MSKQWIVFSAIALALATGPAAAQTPPPVPGGAFDQLSPGNQKIARAIFESQQFSPTPPTAPKPLSLDQIAGLKQSGRGWGVVYKDLQAKGLVTDRNLGQAVSRFNHEQKSAGPPASRSRRAAERRCRWVARAARGVSDLPGGAS